MADYIHPSAFLRLFKQVSKFWRYLHLKLVNGIWKACLGWKKGGGPLFVLTSEGELAAELVNGYAIILSE